MATPNLDFLYFRGRVGLRALLKALGVGKGEKVATQAFTCVAVPEAIMAAGAEPLWIDIEADGVNMDADDLATKLSGDTKALVIQHTYGIPADMDRILPIAERAGIPVIEDCCHTLASGYRGKTVGTAGVGSFYSFEWGKPIIVGIGGAVAVNDESLRAKIAADYASFKSPPALRMMRLRSQYLAHKLLMRPSLYWTLRALYHKLGRVGLAESNYNPIEEGKLAPDFTWTMSGHHQRLLRKKLARMDEQVRHARWVAAEYDRRLPPSAGLRPTRPEGSDCVFARYPLLVEDKPALLDRARTARVEASAWYETPVHPLVGRDLESVHYHAGSCPNAERNAGRIVSLPTGGRVSEKVIDGAIDLFG